MNINRILNWFSTPVIQQTPKAPSYIDADNNLFIEGNFVGSYSRRRDARRGARRRGVELV